MNIKTIINDFGNPRYVAQSIGKELFPLYGLIASTGWNQEKRLFSKWENPKNYIAS